MDMKILAAIAAVLVLASAGLAFASSGFNEGRQGSGKNETWKGQANRLFGPERNATLRGNSTELAQFRQALQSNDFSAAKQLHNAYGFGGPLFGKLNETTFAKYSEISRLSEELRQELGMKISGPAEFIGDFGNGRPRGNRPEFGSGAMPPRAREDRNESAISHVGGD
jgi:hypothetical protein